MATRNVYFKAKPSLVSTDDLNAALAIKANTTDVNTGLSAKADITYVDTAVAGKASASDIAGLASTTYVDNALAGKADASALNDLGTQLSNKVDAADLDTALATKLDVSVHEGRVANENDLFEAIADGLFIEAVAGSNAEFDYAGKGLVNPA